jgi:protease I
MKTALLVIANVGYQDHELAGTRNALLDAGFEVTIASTEAGACTGKFGGTEEALLAMREVDPASYDILAFIGGPGARALKDDPDALALAKARFATGKILGAICIAPTILAAAGVLKGKRATVWDDGRGTQERFLVDHGAVYTGESVTVDGSIITGNGPDAAEAFGEKLASVEWTM